VVNDTLPTALTQFGDELTRAIARELSTPEPTPPSRRRPPHRRRMLAGAAAACALAGAAAGVALVANGSSSANSASDQHVLRAAEIALPKPAPNTIVHVSVTQTMTPAARSDSALLVPTVDADGWFQQGGQRRSVTREQIPGQTPTWQTASRVYDPATKRVYVNPPFPSNDPRFTLTKNGRTGSYTLRIATSHYGPVNETITSAQARALRTGADGIQWQEGLNASGKFFLGAAVVSKAQSSNAGSAGPPSSTSLSFPAQLHRLLQSGHAQVDGHVTIDGRTAIKIAISGVSGYQRMTYYVDPTTYRPIELDNYGVSSKDLTRIVFHAYQQLPLKGNTQLLRIHTSAGTTVDHSPADFYHHIPALLLW
jgi:hypothetical protein